MLSEIDMKRLYAISGDLKTSDFPNSVFFGCKIGDCRQTTNFQLQRVRANLDLDVRGACVQRKKRSQLTPWTVY